MLQTAHIIQYTLYVSQKDDTNVTDGQWMMNRRFIGRWTREWKEVSQKPSPTFLML